MLRDFGPLLMMVALAASGCSSDSDASSPPNDAGALDGGDAAAVDGDAKADALPNDASTPDATPATVEEMTSVTYRGVTFTFDRPVPVGHFVTGEPFALSTESFAITDIDPASEDLSGDGHIGHGAMQDPYVNSERIVSGTATLTIPAGASGDGLLLSVRLSVSTATGLKSGGDARLTLLTLEKA